MAGKMKTHAGTKMSPYSGKGSVKSLGSGVSKYRSGASNVARGSQYLTKMKGKK